MRIKLGKNYDINSSESTNYILKQYQQFNENLSPNEKALEYKRAMNGVKIERIFAKPFISAFEHNHCVTCMTNNKLHPNSLFTGCADGEINLWDVFSKRKIKQFIGHKGSIRGLTVTSNGKSLISCCTHSEILIWKLPSIGDCCEPVSEKQAPYISILGKHPFCSIDHHHSQPLVATAGATVEIWDYTRQEPIHSFSWGSDTTLSVRFNPIETDVLLTSDTRCNISLYDLRTSIPIRKLTMPTRTNAVAWNPVEAFNFTAANNDSALYTFDMRNLKSALHVHKDFTNSVMDIDYSPAGKDFVAGSIDCSIRIFQYNKGHSREVYTTSRMQRVDVVKFSVDGEYIFSGSDDMNVRMWRAEASKSERLLLPAQRKKKIYNDALIGRYMHSPEVANIINRRFLPKKIFNNLKLRRRMVESQKLFMKNKIAHSSPKLTHDISMRMKKIVKEDS
jgi:WD repeat and SOF domain-containing protein 1